MFRENQFIDSSYVVDANAPLCWTVDHFLSKEECIKMIHSLEQIGFTSATISDGKRSRIASEVRNNTRIIKDDQTLAAALFQKALPYLPQRMSNEGAGLMQVIGANERFRFYRYHPGQFFALHVDGSFKRNDDEFSLLTFMIYLNDDFGGGETYFAGLEKIVEPKTGTALFFQHRLRHEGCEVIKGVKYVLRTDVMYQRIK